MAKRTAQRTAQQSTLEDKLQLLKEKATQGPLTVRQILKTLSGKGRAFLLVLLCLPFCQPIQIPGMSTPFGVAIVFIGLRMLFGEKIWLPKRLLDHTVQPKTLRKLIRMTLAIMKKMNRFIHPRLERLCAKNLMWLHGITIMALGVILALPLPIPFSNLIVAWALLLLGLGLLKNDGLFIILGYVIALLALSALIFLALATQYLFTI